MRYCPHANPCQNVSPSPNVAGNPCKLHTGRPKPESNPVPLHCQADVLTTGPPGRNTYCIIRLMPAVPGPALSTGSGCSLFNLRIQPSPKFLTKPTKNPFPVLTDIVREHFVFVRVATQFPIPPRGTWPLAGGFLRALIRVPTVQTNIGPPNISSLLTDKKKQTKQNIVDKNTIRKMFKNFSVFLSVSSRDFFFVGLLYTELPTEILAAHSNWIWGLH